MENFGKDELSSFSHRPPYCSLDDYVRWKDYMNRNFTINGLMYDPFANLIYDYSYGMGNIKTKEMYMLKHINWCPTPFADQHKLFDQFASIVMVINQAWNYEDFQQIV